MAGELLTKLKELKRKITELNNQQFKKSAVELLKKDKVEEKVQDQLNQLNDKLQRITEEENPALKKEEQLRKMAEKEKKNFDLKKEYAKDKKEYDKEKVVDSINNLIIGKADLATTVDAIIDSAKGVKTSKDKR